MSVAAARRPAPGAGLEESPERRRTPSGSVSAGGALSRAMETRPPAPGAAGGPHRTSVVRRTCAACARGGAACAECAAEDDEEARAPPAGIQARLVVGPADDPYEREADRVADRVMRTPEGAVAPVSVQEEEEPEAVQGKGSDGGADASPAFAARLAGLRGGGRPLSRTETSFFEPRFGRDLSPVRIHTGPEAARASAEIGALAFTHGPDIVFGAGAYAPGGLEGRRLLAHELAHTIQQGAVGGAGSSAPPRGDVQRKGPKTPYRARVVAGKPGEKVLACQSVNAEGCRTDVLTPGMDVTVTSTWVGGAWSFVEQLPDEAVEALRGQKGIYVPSRFVPALPRKEEGAAPAAAAPNPDFLRAEYREVNEPGIVYQPTGANLRDRPLPPEDGSKVLVHLPQNTKVFVLKHDPKAHWYAVTTTKAKGGGGTFGYVADWLLWRKLPEPDADVVKVEAGDTPLDIVREHYRGEGFTGWGKDLRYLVNALVYINQRADHNGVGPPGITKPKGDVTADWSEARARAEAWIWIPGAAFMRAIYKEVVERGGGTGSITADLWKSVKDVLHKVAYGAAFVGGLVHGFVKSLYDAVVGLVGTAVDVLVSIFTGRVIDDARELWDAISKLTWKDIKAAIGDWADKWYVKLSSSSPWVSGHAHGYLTGYIMAEAAQLLISAGALQAAKGALWASRLGKMIQASKAYRTLASGISKATKAGGKTADAMRAAATSLKGAKVFKGLAEAREWAVRALRISKRFAADLSLAAINRLGTLGEDVLGQLRRLPYLTKRLVLGCASPCRVDPDKIRKALAALGRIQVPKAIEWVPAGLSRTGRVASERVLRLARMRRALVGITKKAFKSYNVAVGRFVVDGKDLFVTVVNRTNAEHAEELLLKRLAELRRKHGKDKVKLDELFTERKPCSKTTGRNAAVCSRKLQTESPETKVFYGMSDEAARLYGGKVKYLMETVYGMKPK